MLQDQDRLFITEMAHRVGEIHRGDVVVFLTPATTPRVTSSELSHSPATTSRIDHGLVYVNHKQIDESYVPLRFTDERSQPETVLPTGEYFVMGDHRSISSDSRDFGPVDRT